MNETPEVPGNNTLPQGTSSVGATPKGGAPSKAQAISQGAQTLDKLTGGDNQPQVGEQVVNPNEPNVDENGNPVEGPKVGDTVAPGYEVGPDGKVKEKAGSKLGRAAAIGATAYATGGNTEAMNAANEVSKIGVVKKATEAIDNNAATEKIAKELEPASDAVINTTEAISKAKSGDVGGALKKGGEAAGNLIGLAKKVFTAKVKFALLMGLFTCLPIICGLGLLTVVVLAFDDENGTSSQQVYENTYNYEWEGEDNEGDDDNDEDEDGSEDNGNGEIGEDVILLDIPYYNQNSYGGTKFGGKTIATSGCSVTSLAMVLQYLSGSTITPPNVVNKIADVKGNYNYYYVGDKGQSWSIMTDVPTFYGHSAEQISLASVKNAIAEGKPVIASMSCCTFTKHGHFIVIKGYDPVKGTYYVNDPNHPNFSSTAFSESVFASEAQAFWAFK